MSKRVLIVPATKFGARITFNWGYHDGAAAAKSGRVSYHSIDGNKAAGKNYKAGWRAGFNDFRNGVYSDNSDPAWRDLKQNPRVFRIASSKDFDTVYRRGEKVRKHSRQVSPLDHPMIGGRMLRQRLPHLSKEMHVAIARAFARKARASQRAWTHIQEKEHLRVFGRKPEIFDYKISGIGRDEYSPKAKDLLRALARRSTDFRAAGWAHWRAAGKRGHFPF